jgi:hypothetical protein
MGMNVPMFDHTHRTLEAIADRIHDREDAVTRLAEEIHPFLR